MFDGQPQPRKIKYLCTDWDSAGISAALARTAARFGPVEGWLIDGNVAAAMAASGKDRNAVLKLRVLNSMRMENKLCRLIQSKKHTARQKAQLYFDSYACAAWTSAHAECINTENEPTIFTVPNASASFDFSYLYAQRTTTEKLPKTVELLMHLLARSTNPGSRGWDTVVHAALNVAPLRHYIQHLMTISTTGMHPHLAPASRPGFVTRMTTLNACRTHLTKPALEKMSVEIKESFRRGLATMLSHDAAVHGALAALGHPVRHLRGPPVHLPADGMQTAMANLCKLGKQLDAPRKKEKTTENSWMGKGTSDITVRQPLVHLATEVFGAAHKQSFIALWIHGRANEFRISRLTPYQYDAVAQLNAAARHANSLSATDALRVQRLALRTPTAAMLTLSEVANLMKLPGTSNAIARTPADCARALAKYGNRNSAQLLAFARAARASEAVQIYEFDAGVRSRQVEALKKKYATSALRPVHHTLYACCECSRILNAHTGAPSEKPFGELGFTSSQTCINARGELQLHCAKRSSAALRTSLAAEGESDAKKVETFAVNDQHIECIKKNTKNVIDNGVAARLRRDVKNTQDQRRAAKSCGDDPALDIDILGRAVWIFGKLYVLCEFCANITQYAPNQHTYNGKICCNRCDASLICGDDHVAKKRKAAHICRYCGAPESGKVSNKFRRFAAPLDVAGDNGALPPPLRSVYYCNTHNRNWLEAAHLKLESKVILSHISHGAKPILADADAAEPVQEQALIVKRPTKRIKMKKQ